MSSYYNEDSSKWMKEQSSKPHTSPRDSSFASVYISSDNEDNHLERQAKRRDQAGSFKKSNERPNNFDIAQNDTIGKGLPLLVELVVDQQALKTKENEEDYYSHTGNSWNQSDIDEAYRLYYQGQHMNESEITEPVRRELEESGLIIRRNKLDSFITKIAGTTAKGFKVRLQT